MVNELSNNIFFQINNNDIPELKVRIKPHKYKCKPVISSKAKGWTHHFLLHQVMIFGTSTIVYASLGPKCYGKASKLAPTA